MHPYPSNYSSRVRSYVMLRNITVLVCIVECNTHYSGKHMIIARFLRIYDQQNKVAEDES